MIVERVCGSSEALIAAIKLTELTGVYVDDRVREIEYFHILFDRHEVIFAEGAPSESLFAGPEAIKTLPSPAVSEIFGIFPELKAMDFIPTPARTIPSGAQQKKIVKRHVKNDRPLLGKAASSLFEMADSTPDSLC